MDRRDINSRCSNYETWIVKCWFEQNKKLCETIALEMERFRREHTNACSPLTQARLTYHIVTILIDYACTVLYQPHQAIFEKILHKDARNINYTEIAVGLMNSITEEQVQKKITESTKKCILYVDDNKQMVQSFERTIYALAKEWDVVPAFSGREALGQLKRQRIDMIISDYKMPEMDGWTLLHMVKDCYPHVIRFMMTGYDDFEITLKCAEVADRFLMKPCEPLLLVNLIREALYRRDEHVSSGTPIVEMQSCHTQAQIYRQLQSVLRLPDVAIAELTAAETDEGACRDWMVRVANLVFRVGVAHYGTINDVMQHLGETNLKALLLMYEVFKKMSQEIASLDINKIYEHSVLVGIMARRISQSIAEEQDFIDAATVAGLLHDIGKILLARSNPAAYEQLLKASQEKNVIPHSTEILLFNVSHCDIGAYLMTMWSMPPAIIEAIVYHHTPCNMPFTDQRLVLVTYAANILVYECAEAHELRSPVVFDEQYLQSSAYAEQVPQWRTMCTALKKEWPAVKVGIA